MKLIGFPIKLPNRHQMRSKIDTSIGFIISKIILRIQNDFLTNIPMMLNILKLFNIPNRFGDQNR
jgi:hypothetical protein